MYPTSIRHGGIHRQNLVHIIYNKLLNSDNYVHTLTHAYKFKHTHTFMHIILFRMHSVLCMCHYDLLSLENYRNRIFMYLLGKASVATSAELWTPSEHETVALERSFGVLVIIVEVSGDVDVRLNLYTTPVPRFIGLNSLPITSLRKNITLFMSDPLKKSTLQQWRI